MPKVAVVGTGFVGRAWAISFARAGHDVALWDDQPDAAQAAITYIGSVLPDLAAFELLDAVTPAALRARIEPAASLAEAIEGAVHVQESTPETLDVKRSVFETLDRLASPDAVIASSTSALLPSAFTQDLAGRRRCLVVHPLNPPYLIPA